MRLIAFIVPIVLLACSGSVEPSSETAIPEAAAPLTVCPWHAVPVSSLQPDAAGCTLISGIDGSGTVVAPASIGSDGRCDVPAYEGTDWWVRSVDEVVIWQRDGELRAVQYDVRPCPSAEH